MPNSSNAATRPSTATAPLVGAVAREMILSNVLLPAPLAPSMPTEVPDATSKLTSLSTHRFSCEGTRSNHSLARAHWEG